MSTNEPNSIDVPALRDRLKWSRQQLADYVGVSRTAVSYWERGLRNPSGPVLRLLTQLEAKPEAAA